MKSWPSLEIPPINRELPALELKATSGQHLNRKFFNSYICGITPYDATHLGHAATYLAFDLVHRYQYLRGKNLNFIENITDVDDPLLERATRDGVDWKNLAANQVELFARDMTALHILPPKKYLSVSETIDLVVAGMQILDKQDQIYELEGDHYYDVSKHLSKLPISLTEALKVFGERGGDPDRAGKRHPLDPLVWRKNIPGEPGWESPFGFGRPGWHIECSVIAMQALQLGEIGIDEPVLDIQGGGSDLIFPHHFMTRVIAEDISNRTFAAQYVHTGMIGLAGTKMSKSLGNLVFVHKLLEENIDPMVIRHALLSGKYSADRSWSDDLLQSSKEQIERLRIALSKLDVAPTEPVISEVIGALADDLDTPRALAALNSWALSTLTGKEGGNAGNLSRFIDGTLGLAL